MRMPRLTRQGERHTKWRANPMWICPKCLFRWKVLPGPIDEKTKKPRRKTDKERNAEKVCRSCKGVGLHCGSKKEADYYAKVQKMKDRGEIADFKFQVPFQLEGCKYIADFVIEDLDGTIRVVDVKGYAGETQLSRQKIRQMRERYGIKVEVV